MRNHGYKRYWRTAVFVAYFFSVVSSNATDFDFFRTFLKIENAKPIPEYSLVAHYFSDERSVFVSVDNANLEYKIFELEKETVINSVAFMATSFDGNVLILEDSNGTTRSIAFSDVSSERIAETRTTSKQSLSNWSGKNFVSSETALITFKEIARLIGIPKLITSQFLSLPKPGRTNGGRPGWILDNTIPRLLLLASPFKSGDIIVTVDGISTHQLSRMQQHLATKSNKDYFDVEIQRNGNLKMIRLRL